MTAMSWRTILSLYGGLAGKALFLVGLVVPMAKLDSMGIHFENYGFYLAGSILILFGFVITRACSPSIIVEFITPESYAKSVFERAELNAFDYRIEFWKIDGFQNKEKLLKLANFPETYVNHFPVDNALTVLGKETFSYYFAKLNYAALEFSSPKVRWASALFFILGALSIYFPVGLAIYTYFYGLK